MSSLEELLHCTSVYTARQCQSKVWMMEEGDANDLCYHELSYHGKSLNGNELASETEVLRVCENHMTVSFYRLREAAYGSNRLFVCWVQIVLVERSSFIHSFIHSFRVLI